MKTNRFNRMLIVACVLFFSTNIAAVIYFRTVTRNSRYYATVLNIFRDVLVPLYGDQRISLDLIFKEKQRTCKLLFEDGVVVGMLVYENGLKHSLHGVNVRDALIIKSLFLVNPKRNSRRGLASHLVQEVEKVGRQKLAFQLVVTVSDEKPESLHFFEKKGFGTIKTWTGRYKKDVEEYVLAKRLV